MIKGDYNLNNNNKVTFRYNQLDSSTDVNHNGSGALGTARQTGTTNFLTFAQLELLDSREHQVGRRRVELGVRHVHERPDRRLHLKDESREGRSPLFPFVVIGDGAGSALHRVRVRAVHAVQPAQLQHVPAAGQRHQVRGEPLADLRRRFEKFHSDNSFYFGIQSAYSYNTLADFYADANGYLANPNRTVSPVTPANFQVKYLLQPGQTTPPLQPLDVRYTQRLRPGRVAAAART